jgi:hypothetical protein
LPLAIRRVVALSHVFVSPHREALHQRLPTIRDVVDMPRANSQGTPTMVGAIPQQQDSAVLGRNLRFAVPVSRIIGLTSDRTRDPRLTQRITGDHARQKP